jgi:hypothetical protein
MSLKIVPRACLCSVLILAACHPGPSSSGPDKTSTLERKAVFYEDLAARRDEAARAWGAIAEALPDRLWPTEVAYDGGEVRVAGRALSNDLLADFISRLEASPHLAGVDLRSSVRKSGRTGDFHEFTIAARSDNAGATAPAETPETLLPARPGTADGLRELQRLASDNGLRMTKCVFGPASSGEFAGELPVSVEIEGSRAEIGRYLDGLARLPHFWFVKKVTAKATNPQDPRSILKAAVSALAYYPN